MSSHLLTPAEMEDLAAEAGITMAEACKRAGIAWSTFYRWRVGTTQTTLGVYRRLCEAITKPEAAE